MISLFKIYDNDNDPGSVIRVIITNITDNSKMIMIFLLADKNIAKIQRLFCHVAFIEFFLRLLSINASFC